MISAGEIDPIKIIAVTADVTELNKEECKKAGFDDFVSKPILYKHLTKILKNTLE